MVSVWHALFLACLPLAIVLMVMGEWVAGLAVFLGGTPLFWNLRNRAMTPDPRARAAAKMGLGAQVTAGLREDRAIRGRHPNRFVIPAEVEARLPSANLSDIPMAMRIGSPLGSTDREVKAWLRKLGCLPPGTNFGVVYRACFAQCVEEGEEPLHIRFGWVAQGIGHLGNSPMMGETLPCWILVTTRAVRWHQGGDRVPGMPARNPLEAPPPGVREVFYRSPGFSALAVNTRPGPGGIPVQGLALERRDGDSTWRHVLLLGADPSTEALIADVLSRSKLGLWLPPA